MSEYPKMLYKLGGEETIFGHAVTTIVVEDAQAEKDAGEFVEADLFISVLDEGDQPKPRGRPRKAE